MMAKKHEEYAFIQAVKSAMTDVSADELMPHFKNLNSADITQKSDDSVVTIADKACEIELLKRLNNILPDAAILGEESYEQDPSIKDNIHKKGYCWVVDPLDGTHNFARGDERFGMIIALLKEGKPVAGFLYCPTTQEMFYTVKGRGVFDINDTPILPFKKRKDLRKRQKKSMHGFSNYIYFGKHNELSFTQLVNKKFGYQGNKEGMMFSSCIEYISMIKGESDFMINSSTKPWDHAAGQLMIQELGGKGRSLYHNKKYKPQRWHFGNHELLITTTTKHARKKLLGLKQA